MHHFNTNINKLASKASLGSGQMCYIILLIDTAVAAPSWKIVTQVLFKTHYL